MKNKRIVFWTILISVLVMGTTCFAVDTLKVMEMERKVLAQYSTLETVTNLISKVLTFVLFAGLLFTIVIKAIFSKNVNHDSTEFKKKNSYYNVLIGVYIVALFINTVLGIVSTGFAGSGILSNFYSRIISNAIIEVICIILLFIHMIIINVSKKNKDILLLKRFVVISLLLIVGVLLVYSIITSLTIYNEMLLIYNT